MGIAASFVVHRGLAPEAMRERLGLSPGQPDHDWEAKHLRGTIAEATYDDGWTIIEYRDLREDLRKMLPAVSSGAELVIFQIEEHVNFSEAALWRDGAECWRLRHQGDVDDKHIEVWGLLPAEIASLLEAARAAADDKEHAVGMYDLPTEAAALICGFRYDVTDPRARSWTRLTEPRRKGFLARMFG